MKRFSARTRLSTRPVLALAALAITLPLAACSSMSGAESAPAIGGAAVEDMDVTRSQSNPFMPTDGSVAESGDPAQQEADGSQTDQSIIKTGSITIEVENLETGVEAVAEIAEGLGGSVASQHISEYSGTNRNGYLSIDVPADRFDDAFDELSGLGTVRSDERSKDDVTTQHVDLQARVAALQTSVDRLTDMLANAATTSDLLDIERMLSERQANLDGLEAQLRSLEGRVAESNIQVMLSEPSVLPGGGPQSFWDALKVGLASIGSFAASAVIVLGVALPWLVALAIIAAIIVIPLRNRRKRRAATQNPANPTDSVANTPEG